MNVNVLLVTNHSETNALILTNANSMYAIQMHHAPTPSEVGRFRLITDCKKFYENFENFSEMFPRLTIYVKDLSVNVTPDTMVMV